MARRAVCVALALCALASVVVSAVPAGATTGEFRRVGSLDRKRGTSWSANGNIVVDYRARRLYQTVVLVEQTLYEYDLDSMLLLRTMRIPDLQPAFTTSGQADWLWTLDDARRRLFAVRRGAPDATTGLETYALLTIDLRAWSVGEPRPLWPLGDRIPLVLSYDAASDRLYALSRFKYEGLGRSAIFLEERRTDATQVWDHHLRACHSATDHQYAPSLWRSRIDRGAIYLNCYNQGNILAQVVRVRLDSSGAPSADDVFPAVPGALSTMFDPGSDRLFFLTTNSGAGRGAWVFDGRRSSFLGVIASGDNRIGASDYAMGVDPVHGRLYMQTPAGFLIADARRTPLPAGLLFREYAGYGTGLIQVDPARRRVFVPDPRSVNDIGQAQRYAIFQDGVPTSNDPAPGDPDALTLGVEEKPGLTAANVSGSARAYGVRALTTGGAQRGVWNVLLGQFNPEDEVPSRAWGTLSSVPLESGDREVQIARVHSVTLTNDAADASAFAIEPDEGSVRDVERAGATWPFEETECHATTKEPDTATGPAETSSASCDVSARAVVASAGVLQASSRDVSAAAPALRVASTYALGSALRDAKRGLVSRASSSIVGISILDRVWIGSLTTEAETWARGRRGAAGARFDRVIANVRVDSDGDGDLDYSCGQCDPDVVRQQIDRALAGQVSVTFPTPDAAFYPSGSPGGYQAVVEKDRFRSYAERALNDDESVEVPGMQIVYYSDARAGRTRQVVQLAGVQAESHYGIYMLPSDDGYVDDPRVVGPPAIVPPAPVVTLSPAPVSAPRAPSSGGGKVLEQIVRRIAEGVGVFVANPRQLARMVVLWLFLALPAYLAYKRRGLRT